MKQNLITKFYNPIIIKNLNSNQSIIKFNTIEIKAESNDLRSLNSLKIKLNKFMDPNRTTNLPPTKIKIYSPIKSPHVNKSSREQLGLITHKKLFLIENCGLLNPRLLKVIRLLNFVYSNTVLTTTFNKIKTQDQNL